MDRKVISEVVGSVFHNFNPEQVIMHVMLNALAFVASYFGGFLMDNLDQFIAITAVLVLDSVAGIACAIKFREFETRKALKFIWYFVGYIALLSVCLLVEKAFVGTFWLSETVIIPILTFQVISILKNMHRFGVISSEHLGKILSKIDKYKDETNG